MTLLLTSSRRTSSLRLDTQTKPDIIRGETSLPFFMNIFAVDIDPITAARQLPDRHVTKMILESCQMLSLVFSSHYWDIGEVMKVDGTPFKTDKGAFKKHPCTIWAADAVANCAWLIQHACGLCGEFNIRYGHKHGLTNSVFETKKLFHRETGDPITVFRGVESFARAMPDEFKLDTSIDDITAYRMYVSSKPWVKDNYLRLPDRKPSWVA